MPAVVHVIMHDMSTAECSKLAPDGDIVACRRRLLGLCAAPKGAEGRRRAPKGAEGARCGRPSAPLARAFLPARHLPLCHVPARRPTVTADYVHCVGRTARRGRAGRVSCLVESREQVGRYRHLHALQPAQRLTFEGVS